MWANTISIVPDRSRLDNLDMVNKAIKLMLQYLQATCHRDQCMRHAMVPKHILTPNLAFLLHIQIWSGLDLARTETKGQGHSDLEPVGDSPGPKMYLHTKYETASINIIGDLLRVHFFKTSLLRSM